jgi:gamma-glutamyl-gamma-aminobutyrate hydrolase PuuD
MRLIAVGDWFGVHEVFREQFKSVVIVNKAIPLTKDDVVLFGGGADIYPGLYGEEPGMYAGVNRMGTRDTLEKLYFDLAQGVGAACLGVCRGAQLLCALSGGKVIQHVTHHAGENHSIETVEGEDLLVSSCHHQMMNPFTLKPEQYKLVAWAHNRSTCYLTENEKTFKMPTEPEVVYFPETKSLGMQYHPEFMPDESRGVKYALQLVEEFIL